MDKKQIRNICILLAVLLLSALSWFLLGRNTGEEKAEDSRAGSAI